MRNSLLALLALLASSSASATDKPAPEPAQYRIIVHPSNPVVRLDSRLIAEVFLKKVTRWENGQVIKPADLGRTSSVRRRFAREILGRTLEAVRHYWQQQIFSGRDVPPPEFDTEEQVVHYVLRHHAAIGYVSTMTDLRGARALTVD
jgi:ABC-type phosphate transport system substrate-binding protein